MIQRGTHLSFDQAMRRGAVLYCIKLRLRTTTKNKFIIVLSHDAGKDPIYFCLTTSKTKHYRLCPRHRHYFIVIPKDRVHYFPVKTLVDCMGVTSLPRKKLKAMYRTNELQYKGMLPQDLITDMLHIVENSTHISENDRQSILSP